MARRRPALATQMAVAAVVFVAFAAGARAWLSAHRRGPLEAAVRALIR